MAKFTAALAGFVESAKQHASYWVEVAKLDFALSLEAKRRQSGLSYSAIAKKLGTSAAYISKVFRGDSNLTIESMVKLADATGGRLEVKIVDANAAAQWEIAPASHARGSAVMQTMTVVGALPASNHDHYHEAVVG